MRKIGQIDQNAAAIKRYLGIEYTTVAEIKVDVGLSQSNRRASSQETNSGVIVRIFPTVSIGIEFNGNAIYELRAREAATATRVPGCLRIQQIPRHDHSQPVGA